MNKVMLIGNLTKDPEVRTTTTGKKVVSFSMAINDGKDATGKEQVQYFNLTAWDQRADILEMYVKKGHKIAIVGRLANRSYQRQDGTTAYTTDITVTELELLTSRAEAERLAASAPANPTGGSDNSGSTDNKPSGDSKPSTKSNPKEEQLPEIDINNMDLNVQMPF
jgi:single-strand DNA-binding protein